MTFAKGQGISVREFERRCNLTEGYINAIRKSASSEKIAGVKAAFPELNVEWLLTGIGEMTRPAAQRVVEPPVVQADYERLLNLVDSQQETIRMQAETIKNLSVAVAK